MYLICIFYTYIHIYRLYIMHNTYMHLYKMYLPRIIYTLYQRTMQGTQHAQIKQCYMFPA